MSDIYPKIKVAAIQAAPVFLDREATAEKACRLIREAGSQGADVAAFPESFIPGHPLWYHFHPATSPLSIKLATELFKNSIEIPGPVVDALCEAAKQANCHVVIGVCERRPGTFGTLYNSQVFINRNGQLLGKHQKLVPTVGERLVHTGGYGDTLHAYETDFGKMSGLICGENSNPLAMFALIAEGTMLHVASWPNHGAASHLSRADRATSSGRAFAMMAKAYVVNVGCPVTEAMADTYAATEADRAFLLDPKLSGGSSIIDPTSVVIAGPMGNEEGILYADIDLEVCVREKITHDLAGHYNRADIFNLSVNRNNPTLLTNRGQTTDHESNGDNPDATLTSQFVASHFLDPSNGE